MIWSAVLVQENGPQRSFQVIVQVAPGVVRRDAGSMG
ncbi:MAG: hypothetical protein JWP07_3808, partial [Pseudonocardiales bacterium]|nr:hypothetical protein [Pseudonocardiales bacterium]